MADLGAVAYSAVIWTAGDIITEAKLDAMVANDQAYDSHKDQGLLLANNRALAGRTTGAIDYNFLKMNSSNIMEIGDASLDGITFMKPITKPTLNGSVRAYTSDNSGNFDLLASNTFTRTLNGSNGTLGLDNVSVGQAFVIRLVQDGTGSRTVTWFSTIKWQDAVAPTLTTTANKTDVFGFLCTSAGNYDGYYLGQNL